MTAHLTMDEQGRVLIPPELRPGEPLDAQVEEGRLVFVGGSPITGDPVQDMRDQRLKDLIERSK